MVWLRRFALESAVHSAAHSGDQTLRPLGALARLEQDVEQQQVRSGPDSLELLRIVGRTSTQLSTMWGGSDARHKQGPRSLVRIQETVMVPFGLKPQVDGDF